MAKVTPLTTAQIEAQVKSFGPKVVAAYYIHKKSLLAQMDKATEESPESLAGFLFAQAEISNVITQRHKLKK